MLKWRTGGGWGTATALVLALLLADLSRGGTIFDDDWTPPAPRKASAATAPATSGPGLAPAKAASRPPPPPATTVTPTSLRRPIPEKADQARSRALFKQVFGKELADRSPSARRALSARLLDEAAKVADVPADQFVLMAGAADAAREGADLALCSRAADAMAAGYEIDGLQVKADAATKISLRADSPAVTAGNCRAGLALADELVAAEEYTAAARLLTALRAAASVAGDPEIVAQVQLRAKDLDVLRTAADRAAPSIQRLKAAPDDPAANLAAGQYYCFFRGDWGQGLPMLAKGSDPKFKGLALAELAGVADAEVKSALADGWWEVASARRDLSHVITLRHAVQLYEAAHDGTSGLRRTAIERRLEEARGVLAAAQTSAGPTAGAALERSAGPRSVLLFLGSSKEKEVFGPISSGTLRTVSRGEIGPLLATDPAQTFARYGVIVWGRNVLRDTPAEQITETARQAMLRHVRDGGGDLVLFEQYAMGNMDVIEKLFGIKAGGGANGALVVDDGLKARAEAAGYTEQSLKAIHFHNSYPEVPKESRILLRGADNGNPATGVLVPCGKGRLILLGTNMDPADEKLDKEFFDAVYRYKSSGDGVGTTPPAAVPRPLARGGATFLSDARETDSKLGHPLLKGGKSFNGADTLVSGEFSAHALSTHAVRDGTAYVEYDLGGRFRSFTAKVGILDAAKSPPTPLVFRVVGDGKVLWESKPLSKGERPTPSCAVDLAGVKVLRLEVQCAGDNESAQAVWLEPQVR
jgi:hypothetical protein